MLDTAIRNLEKFERSLFSYVEPINDELKSSKATSAKVAHLAFRTLSAICVTPLFVAAVGGKFTYTCGKVAWNYTSSAIDFVGKYIPKFGKA